MPSNITVGNVIDMIETVKSARLIVGEVITGEIPGKDKFPFVRPNADYDFQKIEEILCNLKIDQNQ